MGASGKAKLMNLDDSSNTMILYGLIEIGLG